MDRQKALDRLRVLFDQHAVDHSGWECVANPTPKNPNRNIFTCSRLPQTSSIRSPTQALAYASGGKAGQ